MASIGIIGGADGPTAVFLSGNTDMALLAGIPICAALLIGFLIYRKKK